MTDDEFRRVLHEEMDRAGGKRVLVERLRERRRDLNPEQARNQVNRALMEPVGLEIARNVLGATGIERSRMAELLRLDGEDDPIAPRSSFGRAFRMHPEFEPVDGGDRVERDGGVVYVGGCKIRLSLANTSTSVMTVVGMRALVAWRPPSAARRRRVEKPAGAGVVPHQLFLELSREPVSGWWNVSEGTRLSDEPRRIEPTGNNLLESPGLPRLLFKIPPGDVEWLEVNVLPREAGDYTVHLDVMALGPDREKAERRVTFRVEGEGDR